MQEKSSVRSICIYNKIKIYLMYNYLFIWCLGKQNIEYSHFII